MVNSNDFSLFALFTAGFSAVVSAAAPSGPTGNSFKTPGLATSVACGKPFDVTWTPSTSGTVTIYVCEGPSTNCVDQPAPIAANIANSGSFSWTPSCSLHAGATAGLGLKLVAADGEYQYTPQFGVTGAGGYVSSSVSMSASQSGYTSASANSTSMAATSSAYPTYTPPANTTVVSIYQSASMTPSATGYSAPSTTGAASPSSTTNAAAAVRAGAGLAAGVVAAFLAL